MQTERKNKNSLPQALIDSSLPPEWGLTETKGKVRDVYNLGNGKLFFIATDRLSAIDVQVGLVPGRGQILNELSAFWFNRTQSIVPNHMIEVIDPNVMVVKEYDRIDLEMVVRGYNTGSTKTSIWKRYTSGQREFGGVKLPDGIKKNQSLPFPILDLTTKAYVGHDTAITKDEILSAGIVTPDEYEHIEKISLQLFASGEDIARRAGLILVDTKYEFGRDKKGNIILIDEIHTPDSSRFWGYSTYEEKMKNGESPDIYDKEFVRLWLSSVGYEGEGGPPKIPEEVLDELRNRYIYAYENLTHNKFKVPEGDVNKRIVKNIGLWLGKNEN